MKEPTLIEKEVLYNLAELEARLEARQNEIRKMVQEFERTRHARLNNAEKQTIRNAIAALGTCSHCDNIDPAAFDRLKKELKQILSSED